MVVHLIPVKYFDIRLNISIQYSEPIFREPLSDLWSYGKMSDHSIACAEQKCPWVRITRMNVDKMKFFKHTKFISNVAVLVIISKISSKTFNKLSKPDVKCVCFDGANIWCEVDVIFFMYDGNVFLCVTFDELSKSPKLP